MPKTLKFALTITGSLGKRIYRLSSEEALAQSTSLIGQNLNLVLQDTTVFFGKLKSVTDSWFFMENMLGKSFQFTASQVKEVIYDKRSAY